MCTDLKLKHTFTLSVITAITTMLFKMNPMTLQKVFYDKPILYKRITFKRSADIKQKISYMKTVSRPVITVLHFRELCATHSVWTFQSFLSSSPTHCWSQSSVSLILYNSAFIISPFTCQRCHNNLLASHFQKRPVNSDSPHAKLMQNPQTQIISSDLPFTLK